MQGFNYLVDGFKLVLSPGLKRYFFIPFLLNIIFFFIIFWVAKIYINEFLLWMSGYLPRWLAWLNSILQVVFWLLFLVGMVFSFVTLANIIGAPFNTLLAEKVFSRLTGKDIPERKWLELIKDVPRVVWRQCSLVFYYLFFSLILFILCWVPVVQLVIPFIWLIWNAWFFALQNLDYPSDIEQVSLDRLKQKMRRAKLTSLSFGFSILVLAMIPGINLIVIPAAVAGATKLWVQELALV